MESFIQRKQVLMFYKEEVDKRSYTFSTPEPRLRIDLIFTGKLSSSDWVIRQGSRLVELCRITKLPRKETYVKLNRNELSCHEKAREIIGERLLNWPVKANKVRRLIDIALVKAREMVRCMPPHHNHVSVHFPVVVWHLSLFDEDRAVRWAAQRSIEEEGDRVRMVPATEGSIELLETRVMDCGAGCSVCLEEISGGCEGLLMPCLHVFHEDCIKEWLRTSHYCPVCRFELPKREVLNLE